MIFDKILKCRYAVQLDGQACNVILDHAKFKIKTVKMVSELFDDDISATNSVTHAIDTICDYLDKNSDTVVKEFNPEFYPTLNVNGLKFEPEIIVEPTEGNLERTLVKVSKDFDKRGDFTSMRISAENISGYVMAEPEAYLREKHRAHMNAQYPSSTNQSEFKIH